MKQTEKTRQRKLLADEERRAEVEKAVEEAFNRLRRNASISHIGPLPEPEFDGDFNEWLARYAADEMAEIEAVLLTYHHEKLTLAQYGRGGATIAPREWTRESNLGGISVNWDGLETITSPQSANRRYLRHVVATLNTLNHEVRRRVREIPAAWKDYLEDGDIPGDFGTHQVHDIG